MKYNKEAKSLTLRTGSEVSQVIVGVPYYSYSLMGPKPYSNYEGPKIRREGSFRIYPKTPKAQSRYYL